MQIKQFMKFIQITALTAIAIQPLLGESAPTSAGELKYRLLSPLYSGGGAHITRTESPQGIAMNPAVAAGYQHIVLDANYINLQDLAGSMGMGHAASLSFSYPTRRGVLTLAGSFLDTSNFEKSAMDLGTSGSLNIAFSKEIYSDTWFGFGLVGDVGQLDGATQGGGALNVGFLHFPKGFWNKSNFSWGGSITGLGYRFGSTSRGYFDSVPGNISPSFGAAFDLVNKENFRWAVRSDVRFPSISDLAVGFATDIYLGKTFNLSASSSFSLGDAIAGSAGTLIPSATIGFNFSLNSKTDRTRQLELRAAAAPLYSGIWGFGAGLFLPLGVKDANPPEITVEYPDMRYISPNYDGIQDELLLPYEVSDERYIMTFKWRVVDSMNNTVRTWSNKEEHPENETVKNLFARLFARKEGTPLPDNFRWDGITDSGSLAADGDYSVYLQFSDDNGNSAEAGPFPLVVDTVPPEISLEEPEGLELIFSPDGDGSKDEFSFKQTGSTEQLWEAEIQDFSGSPIKTWTWENESPESIEWNGQNDSGQVVQDNVYRYALRSTDKAGNSNEEAIEGIIIDTTRPEIALTINRNTFSPGTASPISTLTLKPDISLKTGIVDWNMQIKYNNGTVGRTWSREKDGTLPRSFDFNGLDNAGQALPEGKYYGLLKLDYNNGFRPESASPLFTIDMTPPEAAVSANWKIFSPQAGSSRSQVVFSQETSIEESWTGTLTDKAGKVVNQWTWIKQADDTLIWDGRNAEGRLIPDGEYLYILSSVDSAGNAGESPPVAVMVDTSAVEAFLTASLDVFGPTGNGIKDTVNFFMSTRTDAAAADWELTVRNTSGKEIRSWSGKGTPPDLQAWNGKDNTGKTVADGLYIAAFVVNYVKGDSARTESGPVEVDTVAPTINVETSNKIFSPDGDNARDVLTIRQSSSNEEFFRAVISNAENKLVRTWVWTGSLDSVEWDGKDDSGNALPDASYRYVVNGIDQAGNSSSREILGIRIDTAPTPVYLTAKESYILAGETNKELMQVFTALVPNTDGIESWLFAVENEKGQSVISKMGEDKVPGTFTWNGTDENGRPVEGVFKGVLTVAYRKGSRPHAETRPFISDASAPNINVKLNPQPFSPDDDNVDDEVIIEISVEDRSPIKEWSLDINDPRNRSYISFAGKGRPSERIIWDGRSGKGALVESAEEYPYLLRVTDILGNTAEKRGEISVDVLVIRDGDRLKILISNITFQSNSPALNVGGGTGAKNQQVLNRLAQIMKKFGSYRIIVEGHANSLKWANPAAMKQEQANILLPLSKMRAKTVVAELVRRGIQANRLSAEGRGGANPIVPYRTENEDEFWRNRRVEFYLVK